ncbi:MAG: FAD-dependent thymidylate synthase [Brevinematales bacterium]|nr:FAD-dependent thymidylate synthase [Brevinematales bacterium]
MKVELISINPDCEKHIEYCARTCYNSLDKMTADSHKIFLANLIKNGHLSVLEHSFASFLIDEISRACSHQLVRQRLASFSQRSQRYVNEKDFSFVIPPEIEANTIAKQIYLKTIEDIQISYAKLVDMGIKKEDARFLLPNASHTTITMTANFREWLHIIDLRVSKHAQWEIRDLFINIWKLLFNKAPTVFSEIYFLNWSKDYEYKKEIFETKIKSS